MDLKERNLVALDKVQTNQGDRLQKGNMSVQKNNPLHGITLEQILTDLEAFYGWKHLGLTINIRCFKENPSVKSSLKFLRKTPWARTKVEQLYLKFQTKING